MINIFQLFSDILPTKPQIYHQVNQVMNDMNMNKLIKLVDNLWTGDIITISCHLVQRGLMGHQCCIIYRHHF